MSTIAPLKGMLRKRLFTDVTIALGGGTLVAMGFWYGWHLPRNQIRTYLACGARVLTICFR